MAEVELDLIFEDLVNEPAYGGLPGAALRTGKHAFGKEAGEGFSIY